jgi:hypothetical protein
MLEWRILMAITIGIYDKEEKLLDGIRALMEAGAERVELRVVVNNTEGAPLIASRDDIQLEELYAIQDRRKGNDDEGFPAFGVIPVGVGYSLGNSTIGAGPALVMSGALDSGSDEPSSEVVLADLGIPSDAVDGCAKAVESGKYLLVADSESNKQYASILRNSGADEVIE